MGESVLDQGKAKAAAPASVLDQPKAAKASGEQSVLGGSANHKPLTFYKKAWFWIIVAVVVLGTGGLVAFLVINANITAQAIEDYGKNALAATDAVSDFKREFRSAFNDSGLGYYSSNEKRTEELRDKCLEKLDIKIDDYKSVEDIKYINGEKAADELGTGETRKLSEGFKRIADGLSNIDDKMDACKDMLKDTLKGDYELKIGDFEVNESSYSVRYKLPVTIKNKSDYTIRFYVKLKAVSKDGKELGKDTFYSTTLKPGESDDDEMFNYGYYSTYETLKDAKFEVVEVTEYSVK